jgi:hypothetical protein
MLAWITIIWDWADIWGNIVWTCGSGCSAL